MADNVLFVEDDDRIRLTLRMNLEDEGFTVLEAATGEIGVALARSEVIDVAIVDLGLPGIDGFEVVRAIRDHSRIPIVILTARNETHDVVTGLEAGADDYVVKPVAPKELAARLRALVRRSTVLTPVRLGVEDDDLRVGPLLVRPSLGEATWHGRPLALTRTEYRIICELAAHPGQLVTREHLLDKAWGYDYLGDMRLVDSQIYRLRAKLEEKPAQPQHLITVRGMGYKLLP